MLIYLDVLEFTEKHLESKAVLRHVRLLGGHVCVVGSFGRLLASFLEDFNVIWGAKMKLKSTFVHHFFVNVDFAEINKNH